MSSTSPPAPIHGSCLCGAVQVHIRGGAKPIRTNLCHCTSCQKSSGSFFGAFLAHNVEDVTFETADLSAITVYEDTNPDSGRVLERSFCGRCGSPVKISSRGNGQLVVVAVGILDGDKEAFRPTEEFYCRSRPSFLGPVQGALTHETQPTGPPS